MRARVLPSAALLVAACLVVLGSAFENAQADESTSGSGSSSLSGATATTGPPASARATAALRATAVLWAKTFLTGSAEGMRRLQGPECRSKSATSSLPKSAVALYLRGLRGSMRRQLGKPLDQVHILGVDLRNVTANRGEAQVVYDLPEEKVGNDNWVEYTLHRGHWKVSDCHAPILGHSTVATPALAAPASTIG